MFFSSTVTPGLPQRNRTSVFPAVKPHTPANVKAVSHSSGVLEVTWQAPPLPVDGLQCQFQYYSPSTVSPQPKWKVSLSQFSNHTLWLNAWCGGFTNQWFKKASKVWNEWYFYNDMILDDCQNSTAVSFLWNTQNKICQMKYFFKWYRMLWYNLSLCVSYEIKLQSSDWKILLDLDKRSHLCSHLKICSKYQKYKEIIFCLFIK